MMTRSLTLPPPGAASQRGAGDALASPGVIVLAPTRTFLAGLPAAYYVAAALDRVGAFRLVFLKRRVEIVPIPARQFILEPDRLRHPSLLDHLQKLARAEPEIGRRPLRIHSPRRIAEMVLQLVSDRAHRANLPYSPALRRLAGRAGASRRPRWKRRAGAPRNPSQAASDFLPV
jgi:hypothetical protein